ncbi:hypothetical protein ACOXVJ_20160 [Pseudomonas knackmussii]|uniref:hypothetical protein n=1 Tax=Pseudomonas knackmussii TaxID=65741 RepID=UPI0012EC82D9|nr:hypothetical protein [Pseudomonas knackmussii]
MNGVRYAALQRGSKRYVDEGDDHLAVLIGDIRPEGKSSSLRAFVKICQNRAQLHAELVGSTIGRALGVKIPEPYLVIIKEEARPPIDVPLPVLGFGTAAVAGHTFARLGNFAQLHLALKDIDLVAAFDQLIANSDRHLGQMIYDGKDHWAIDHAQSFGGSTWHEFGLPSPEIDIINWLLERSDYGASLEENEVARFALRKRTNKSFAPLVGKVEDLFIAAGLGRIIDENSLRDLYNWIESRITHAVEQICQKIGLPDMGYAVTSLSDSQSSQP